MSIHELLNVQGGALGRAGLLLSRAYIKLAIKFKSFIEKIFK
ncbi:MAG: hypothetical protein PUA90_04875 [bacterium]|nr:hypothetical protein [bacterium]